MGIDWRTVGTIVERIIRERLDPTRLDHLTIIGIDELSFRRHHNYVTVIVDHLRKRIIWVGEGKSSETLGKFFDALGPERTKALTHITMELSAPAVARSPSVPHKPSWSSIASTSSGWLLMPSMPFAATKSVASPGPPRARRSSTFDGCCSRTPGT